MRFAKFYAIITQFIVETLFLVFLGMYIGEKIEPDGLLKGVLGVVGGILGIIFFIIYVIRVGVLDERDRKAREGNSDSESGDTETDSDRTNQN